MQFLIDADLPRSIAPLLQRYGHEGIDVRDIGLGSAPDPQIARYAQTHVLCLITGDMDFADVRAYPPPQYHGLVVLSLSPQATAASILTLVESLLRQLPLLESLPSQLAIVEPGRVRLRRSVS